MSALHYLWQNYADEKDGGKMLSATPIILHKETIGPKAVSRASRSAANSADGGGGSTTTMKAPTRATCSSNLQVAEGIHGDMRFHSWTTMCSG